MTASTISHIGAVSCLSTPRSAAATAWPVSVASTRSTQITLSRSRPSSRRALNTGLAAADLVARQLGSEQDLAASVGSDHAVAGQPGPEPVDRPLKAALQHNRPECVEVVLAGEQQQRGDALELGATASGRGQQFTGCQLQADCFDPLPLLVE